MVTTEDLIHVLQRYQDPLCGPGWIYPKAIKAFDPKAKTVNIELGYPIQDRETELLAAIKRHLPADFHVSLSWKVHAHALQGQTPLPQVKNVIAVASGKGGVGKTTVSCNVAVGLALQGARVGILDADIYGPNQPLMLGAAEKPQVLSNKKFKPIQSHGVWSMSMGYLTASDTPVIWRGPMISQAFQQMLFETAWGELDYLLIDLPPGTGDIALTLVKKAPVVGAVIVTTPQMASFLDAKKALLMFEQLSVPVLGVVENMSATLCSNCGHTLDIFGHGAGEQLLTLSKEARLLGSVPLHGDVRVASDVGRPIVLDPSHPAGAAYRKIVAQIGLQVGLRPINYSLKMPQVVVE